MEESAPKLTKMARRLLELEAVRAELYPRLRAALEANDGNVSAAGRDLWPELTTKAARNKCQTYVVRFELAAWAAELREAATGHARGRQDR